MDRPTLNIYIDGLLSLSHSHSDREQRFQLIEATLVTEDLTTLLQDWLLMQDLDMASLTRVQAYFGLTYQQLGRVFNQDPREIAQSVRTERLGQLSSYPPVEKALDQDQVHGLSCFMVEQQLSAWVDSEVQDLRVVKQLHGHLAECHDCKERLESYRSLKQKTLRSRKTYPPISEWEWADALREMKISRERFWRSFAFYSLFAVILVGIIVTFLWVRPPEIPNVYEVP